MRVVMVSKALVVGAYQRKAEEIATLPEIELTVVVPDGWHDPRAPVRLDRAHTKGYELVVLPVAFNGRYHEHFYPTLGRYLVRKRPDVLHMDEEPYNLATWLALRAARRVGAHGVFFTWQNLRRGYPWPYREFEQGSYRYADHAIAGNRAAASVLRDKGYAGPLSIIPQFGVDPAAFSPIASAGGPTDAEGSPRTFAVGYAGRLVPEKGVNILLEACAALPFREWTLSILGDGSIKSALTAQAAELGIADRVCFLAQRPSIKMVDYYRTLDVLVLPSVSRPNWTEQFGRVLIESMACEVPVIGSDCGEIPNVIGDAGMVFPEGDVLALRDLLLELREDTAGRLDMAAKGRRRVLERFTQERIAADTVGVYRSLLACEPTAS